jgi:hypothetical protein
MISNQSLIKLLNCIKILNNKVDLGKVIDPAQELDLVLDLEQGLKQVQLVEKYLQRQAMIEYTRHQLCIHHK